MTKQNDERPIYYRLYQQVFDVSSIHALGLVYNPNLIEDFDKYWKEQTALTPNHLKGC